MAIKMADSTAQLIAAATGRTEAHLVAWDDQCRVHRDVVVPLTQLCEQAQQAGFALRVASGFRSFERQLAIWNAKADGRRPVLDQVGQPLSVATLTEREKMWAILRWSALPGTSRHHWGTDIDVWDGSAVDDSYQIRLTADECVEGGPFYALHCWLDQAIAAVPGGFFRPYQTDRGGIAPEPWHLSYRPVAVQYEQWLQTSVVRELLEASDLALKTVVLDSLDEIFARYVRL